jgi:serine phosphatase RsbU (regulator of sigma subunit)/tetratricopeptide (TPR) repeat protein
LIRLAQLQPELTYLFRHALVQDAAYASLLAEDRRRLHLAVGEAMERLYAERLDSQAATLAHHFHQAGAAEKALHYYLMAGKEALKAFANGEAELNLRRALGLAGQSEERAWLLYALGEAVYRMSRFEEAIDLWRDGIEAYGAHDKLEGVALLYARSARAAWHAGDTPRGLRLCEKGLEAVAGAPESSMYAMLLHEAGRACHFNGMPERARAFCEQALAMAERQEDDIVLADTLTTLGVLGDQSVERSLAYLRRAVELTEAVGILEIGIRAWHNLGVIVGTSLGDLAAAAGHYERAIEIARQRGNVRQEIYSLTNLQGTLVPQGRTAEWRNNLERVETLSAGLSEIDAVHLEIEGMRIQALWWDDKADAALERGRVFLERAQAVGDLQQTQNAAYVIANYNLARHQVGEPADLDEAIQCLQLVFDLAERGIGKSATHYFTLARILAYQGKLPEAHEALARGTEACQKPLSVWDEPHRFQAQAEVAMAEERWDDALADLEAAAAEHGRLGARTAWADDLLRWADALRRRGRSADLKRSQALLREALAVYQEMDVARVTRLAEEMLAQVRTDIMAQAAAHEEAAAELAAAGRIQASFLPERIPSLDGWDIAAILKAARETSGDFYDFINLPGGKLGLLIADVADKGAGAAMFMAMCRSTLRNAIQAFPDEPHSALSLANERILGETHTDMFVTVFLAVLDPASGTLSYCNAGHNPPLLRAATGNIERLDRTGMALGVVGEGEWARAQTTIEPGGIMLLYTDGVTEAQNKGHELFGDERLLGLLEAHSTGTSTELQGNLMDEVTAFAGDAPQFDDMTSVVVRRTEARVA